MEITYFSLKKKAQAYLDVLQAEGKYYIETPGARIWKGNWHIA